MRKLLKTYSISKIADATFTLSFETTNEVIVKFDDELNTISLSEGTSKQTEYSKNYKTSKGKLRIEFIQNFGGAKLVGGDPIIDINDDDLP